MTDIKPKDIVCRYEPLWGVWRIDSLIGEGSSGNVYRVCREEFGQMYYSVVRIISIPHSQADINRFRDEGHNEESIKEFLHNAVRNILREINLMSAIRENSYASENSHIVNVEDSEVLKKTDQIGWDILIRMELLTGLRDQAAQTAFSESEAVRLGIHICRALEMCALVNIIHRDIKPDDIFISRHGGYKLGGFCAARQTGRAISQLSGRLYLAPEICRGEPYGADVDIYGLGMVMYTLLNQNRTPFLPDYPCAVSRSDQEVALQRRLSGEPLPALQNVSLRLNEIILRACAFDRRDRFAGPAEMRGLLEKLETMEDMDDPSQVSSMSEFDRTTRIYPYVGRDATWVLAEDERPDEGPDVVLSYSGDEGSNVVLSYSGDEGSDVALSCPEEEDGSDSGLSYPEGYVSQPLDTLVSELFSSADAGKGWEFPKSNRLKYPVIAAGLVLVIVILVIFNFHVYNRRPAAVDVNANTGNVQPDDVRADDIRADDAMAGDMTADDRKSEDAKPEDTEAEVVRAEAVKAEDIRLNTTYVSLEMGETYQLRADLSPKNADAEITYSGNGIEVSAGGLIRAPSYNSDQSGGTYTITVSAGDISKKVTVEVKNSYAWTRGDKRSFDGRISAFMFCDSTIPKCTGFTLGFNILSRSDPATDLDSRYLGQAWSVYVFSGNGDNVTSENRVGSITVTRKDSWVYATYTFSSRDVSGIIIQPPPMNSGWSSHADVSKIIYNGYAH